MVFLDKKNVCNEYWRCTLYKLLKLFFVMFYKLSDYIFEEGKLKKENANHEAWKLSQPNLKPSKLNLFDLIEGAAVEKVHSYIRRKGMRLKIWSCNI